MAQSDNWKFGVEIPFKNWNFTEFDQKVFFAAAVTSGSTFDPEDEDGTAVDLQTLQFRLNDSVGDLLVLGPSTHANNPGVTETVVISTIANSTPFAIVTVSSIQFDYEEGDDITIRSVPRGWTFETTQLAGKAISRDTASLFGASSPNGKVNRPQKFSVQIDRTDNGGSNDNHALSQISGLNTFLSDNFSHFAVHTVHKNTGSGGDINLEIQQYNADLSSGSKNNTDLADSATYTQESNAFAIVANKSRLEIALRVQPSTSESVNLDMFCASHAQGTDDETSGIWTEDTQSDQGSIRYDYITMGKNIALANNTMVRHDQAGGRRRYFVTSTYTDVVQSVYDNFMILQQFNDEGGNIVFMAFINDLPQIMIGKIRVSAFNKQEWDYGRASFSFRFEEV